MFKKILLSLLLFTAVLNATAPTQENVAKLYVATFDRAPDAAGLAYWINDSGLSLEQIAMSFFDQKETQEKYPSGTTTGKFVETVYTNLFNRAPDDAGLAYWIAELDSGKISRSVFILAVINGALGDDAVILKHKMEVGLYFVEKGLNDADDAIRVMADITEDPATVVAAKKLIDEIAGGKEPPPPSTAFTDAEIEEGDEIFDDALSKMSANTDMTDAELSAKLDDIIVFLKNNEKVVNVEVSDDKMYIQFTTKSGYPGSILFTTKDIDSGISTRGSVGNTENLPFFESKIMDKESSNTVGIQSGSIVGKQNVLILDPFQFDFGTAPSKYLFNGSQDFKVYYSKNHDVTVQSFKNLNNFGIIVINTHSSKRGNLLTGQTANTYFKKLYSEDLKNKRIRVTVHIVLVKDGALWNWHKDNTARWQMIFEVMSSFIEHHNKDLPNSLIFLNACQSMMEGNPMPKMFTDIGAGVVVGYDETVYSPYSVLIESTFFGEMLKGKNIEESIWTAKEEHKINDTLWFYREYPNDKDKDDGTPAYPRYTSGGGGLKILKEDTPPAELIHNGTTYGTVTSPDTGRVWLDRNLGAARVCTAFDDEACYGDYYQWGRNFDGHQDSNSDTNDTQATDVNNAGSKFILEWDWASVDSDGRTRQANWSKTDGSSVCPLGFRVPTDPEQNDERKSNSAAMFESFLKLPSAGYRDSSSDSYRDAYNIERFHAQGTEGWYWSTTVDFDLNPTHAEGLWFGLDGTGGFTYGRGTGTPIRCIKD